MAKYLIVAYDSMYSGLHGMVDWACIEGDYEEACELGHEMGYSVIESYGTIMDSLHEEAEEIYREELDDSTKELNEEDMDRVDNILDELIEEDIEFSIYTLKNDTPIYELNQNSTIDWETIVEEYQKEDNE